jgi:hypothetical protein
LHLCVFALKVLCSFFLGAIRIPGQKPAAEPNGCNLGPVAPKTPARALSLVVRLMA